MSVIVVFVVVTLGFALWWLAQQRVTAKPWLEVGPDPVGGPEDMGLPAAKLALGIFLAVVGALFALFASAYFMRMEFLDWRPAPVPRIVWLNTGLLIVASVALQSAAAAAREGDLGTVRLGLAAAAAGTAGFLAGQLVAWRDLVAGGYPLAGGPAVAFFYLLTAAHGLHVLGGMAALGRAMRRAWTPDLAGAAADRLRLGIELCAMYWHFLLLVWLGVLVLVTGWAEDIVSVCRQLLT
jgi:cytochrome c oxidase subunit 3